MLSTMKKTAKPKTPQKRDVNWEAVAERTREECNKLTNDQRWRLRDDALRLIYGCNAETPTRSR
jgi:hypothetical protein